MKAVMWVHERLTGLVAWNRSRRAFRRYHLSITELRRLHDEERESR